MIDLDIKINKIEKNCIELAKKEAKNLKEENDSRIREAKENLLDDYKDFLAKKYVQELEYLKKEFNKKVFEYEAKERKKLNTFNENIINTIITNVEDEIRKFVNSRYYKKFLSNNIENTLKRFDNQSECIVYVTKRDFDKYGNKLISNYKNAKLDIIDDENIGGCKIYDITDRIVIDNTLRNNINEQRLKLSSGNIDGFLV